jgi:acyl-CoA-binding protein
MSDLNAAFEAAVKNSTSISERPDNATLLKIYALYKQATEGDNEAKKPSFTDMVGRQVGRLGKAQGHLGR